MRHRISLLTLALLAAIGVDLAQAQSSTNNPNHMGGAASGSQIANPQRPASGSNPALATQTLPKEASGSVPPDKNPNVPGATGHTVVPGNNSTLSSDKPETIGEKTGNAKK
jgi:hypothetical protein